MPYNYDEIDRRFDIRSGVAPSLRTEELTDIWLDFMYDLNDILEDGHYKDHAFTKLEEAVAWTHKALYSTINTDVTDHCTDHKPIQHRDMKPPWCHACGRQ